MFTDLPRFAFFTGKGGAAVRDRLAARYAVVPMLPQDPVGPARLQALCGAEPETAYA